MSDSHPRGTVVNPLVIITLVVRPGSGKNRLILDARNVSDHLVTASFKQETLSGLQYVMNPNDYVFTVDLKSGYHQVDVNQLNWTYLGFYWDGRFYVFTQLPFGLAPACWAFTNITRELLFLWRSGGMRNRGYLDELLSRAKPHKQCNAWFWGISRGQVLSSTKMKLWLHHHSNWLQPVSCQDKLGHRAQKFTR
ncbi:hypothetical protein Vretimale_7910 [Volvox reticuliferus]|uniref:Reverse transcriptase domain-containing protein n=1 Tax=Volvox reticuliferus TaxID=1737510 RepID=A0A8J4GA79_9CHLO|nr:hypothetical protein Vretimale_7910 [Volvox reticuliferus]